MRQSKTFFGPKSGILGAKTSARSLRLVGPFFQHARKPIIYAFLADYLISISTLLFCVKLFEITFRFWALRNKTGYFFRKKGSICSELLTSYWQAQLPSPPFPVHFTFILGKLSIFLRPIFITPKRAIFSVGRQRAKNSMQTKGIISNWSKKCIQAFNRRFDFFLSSRINKPFLQKYEYFRYHLR